MTAALVDGLLSSPPVVCLALAYGIVYGLLGVMDLTLGARMAVAGYSGWLALQVLQVTSYPAWAPALHLAAIVGAVAFGALCWALLAPLQRGHELAVLIGSLGISYVASAGLQFAFGTNPRTFATYPVEEGIPFLGTTATPLQLSAAVFAGLTFLAVGLVLRRTTFGTKLDVVATDAEVAQTVFGLRRGRLAWAAMMLASVVVAPAGLLLAIGTGISPATGSSQGLLAFVATITAGRRRPLAAPLVALILVCASSAAVRWRVLDFASIGGCSAVAVMLYLALRRWISTTGVRRATITVLAAGALASAVPVAALFSGMTGDGVLSAQLPGAFQPIAPYAVAVLSLLWRPRGLLALAGERVV